MDLESLEREPLPYDSYSNRALRVVAEGGTVRVEDARTGPVPFLVFLLVTSGLLIGGPLAMGAELSAALGLGACFVVPVLLMAALAVFVGRAYPSRIELDLAAETLRIQDGAAPPEELSLAELRALQVLSWEQEMHGKGGTHSVPHAQLVAVFELEGRLERRHLLTRIREGCEPLRVVGRGLEEHLRVPVREEQTEPPEPAGSP